MAMRNDEKLLMLAWVKAIERREQALRGGGQPGCVILQVNERGFRIGEDHQNAVLSDKEVELIRQLHDDGLSYLKIARKFEVSVSTVAKICTFERRNQYPVAYKKVARHD